MRRIFALSLLAALLVLTWLHAVRPPPNRSMALRFTPLALPSRAALARHLGAFTLEGVWRMDCPHDDFGGYSALVPLGDGRLLALTDHGNLLWFSPPGASPSRPRIAPVFASRALFDGNRDAEALTRDPRRGTLWISWETSNTITRQNGTLGFTGRAEPATIRDWGFNTGSEALVRLADGRFVALSEGFAGWLTGTRHEAVIFADDPVERASAQRLTFVGPAEFSPTDMAQLPDGRVLILLRRLVWPMPVRFAARLAIADPAAIRPGREWRAREVAWLSSTLPVDNFEGLAIEPRPDGRLTVWLMSDDNHAATQRTLLWKLTVDPAALPGAPGMQKGARATPAPSG